MIKNEKSGSFYLSKTDQLDIQNMNKQEEWTHNSVKYQKV